MNDAGIHWLEQLLAKGSSYLSMVGNGFYRFYESFLLEFLAAVSSSVNHHVHPLVCVHVWIFITSHILTAMKWLD